MTLLLLLLVVVLLLVSETKQLRIGLLSTASFIKCSWKTPIIITIVKVEFVLSKRMVVILSVVVVVVLVVILSRCSLAN